MRRGSCPFSWCYSLCSRQEALTPVRAAAGSGAHQRSCLGTRAFSARRRGGRTVLPSALTDRHPGHGHRIPAGAAFRGCMGLSCGCCPRALTARRVAPPPGRPVRPGTQPLAVRHSSPARPPAADVPSVRKGFPKGPARPGCGVGAFPVLSTLI